MGNRVELPFRIVTEGKAELDAITHALDGTGKAVDRCGRSLAVFDQRVEETDADTKAIIRDLEKMAAEELKLAAATEKVIRELEKQGHAYNKLSEQEQAAAQAKIRQLAQKQFSIDPNKNAEQDLRDFAANIKNNINNPLQFAGDLAEDFVLKFGKVGVAGIAVASGLTIGATAAYHLVTQLADAQEQLDNMASRLGLTAQQAEQLSVMAEMSGLNIGALEGAGRLLATALEDTSGAGEKTAQSLAKLGIHTKDATGQQREMGAIVIEVLEALSRIPSTADRVRLANQTLGRGSKELLPLIQNYEELKRVVEAAGVGNQKWADQLREVDKQVDELSVTWSQFKKELGAAIAPVIVPVLIQVKGFLKPGTSGRTSALKGDQQLLQDLDGSNWDTPENIRFMQGMLGSLGNNGRMARRGQRGVEERLTEAKAEADRFLKEYEKTEMGKAERLQKLQARQQELAKTLSGPYVAKEGETGRADLEAEFKKNAALIKTLETKKKEHDVTQQVAQLLASAQENELSGIDKINAKRAFTLEQLGKTPKAIADINKAFDLLVSQQLKAEEVERRRSALQFQLKSLAVTGDKDNPRGNADAEANARIQAAFKELQFTGKRAEFEKEITEAIRARTLAYGVAAKADRERSEKLAEDRAKAEADFSTRAFALNNRRPDQEESRLNQALEARIKAADAIADKDKRNAAYQAAYDDDALARLELYIRRQDQADARKLQSLQARVGYEIRIAELTAKVGDDEKLIETIAAKRLELAEEQYRQTKDRGQLEREVEDILYEKQTKRLELARKHLEDYKDAAGRVYDALTSKGATGIKDLLEGQLKVIERQIFVNIAGKLYEHLGGALKLPQMGGKWGGIFDGTPLGTPPFNPNAKGAVKTGEQVQAEAKRISDQIAGPALTQNKVSTDRNTTSTDRNTMALERLTSTLAAGGLGGGTGSKAAGLIGAAGSAGREIETIFKDDDGNVFASDVSTKKGGGKLAGIGKAAGVGVGLFSAGMGIKAGIDQGGAKGTANAIGSGLMGAATVASMFGPAGAPVAGALMIGALAANIIGGLFGDPKAKRIAQMDKTIEDHKFTEPTAIHRSTDRYGNDVDFDKRGAVRIIKTENYQIKIDALDPRSLDQMGPELGRVMRTQIKNDNELRAEIAQVNY